MRLSAFRLPGRTSIAVQVLAPLALLAAATAGAQTPDSTAPAKPAAAKPAAQRSPSYSLGASMGEQLKAGGISAEQVNAAQLAQGVKDVLTGKSSFGDADKTNITRLLTDANTKAVESNHKLAADFLAKNGKKPGVVTTASGLEYQVIKPGSGASPGPTDQVTVNYRGTLLNGDEFDSSYKRGQPASFPLNHVIPGWSEGVALMKPGAKYTFWVPPQLAYDERSPSPQIPPGSMLVFEVELLSSKPSAPPAAAPLPQAPKQ